MGNVENNIEENQKTDYRKLAILPLNEKAKYIIQLREKGASYREIAEKLKVSTRDIARVLKGNVPKDEIEKLKEEIKELREEINVLYEILNGKIERLYELALSRAKYYMRRCAYYDGKFCNNWVYKEKPTHLIEKYNLAAKEVNGKWYLEATPEFCLACRVRGLLPLTKRPEKEFLY